MNGYLRSWPSGRCLQLGRTARPDCSAGLLGRTARTTIPGRERFKTIGSHSDEGAKTSQEAVQATVTQPADTAVPKILVVDDEPGIRSFIGRALGAAGYVTDFAATGADALRRAHDRHYDLVILDLVMPDLAGQVVLERLLAARPDQAVLVLSCLADVAAKVECLELGAQDYLTKPFSLAELLARVRVRLRGGADPLGPGRVGEFIRAGGLTLDVSRLVADIGAGAVPLTRLEFLLLRELAEHAGQSVPKGQLLATVWGYDFDPGSNVVDVCVRRLRSKLGFDLIKTVRGEGYQLAGH
jgi:two-component system OmpR family response regulator